MSIVLSSAYARTHVLFNNTGTPDAVATHVRVYSMPKHYVTTFSAVVLLYPTLMLCLLFCTDCC